MNWSQGFNKVPCQQEKVLPLLEVTTVAEKKCRSLQERMPATSINNEQTLQRNRNPRLKHATYNESVQSGGFHS